VQHICEREPEGAVLVFLTGWDEISNLHKSMQANPAFAPARTRVLPLHGSMPTAHQQGIFARPPPGVRKVVLATNIAETSITIDDVVYVVDGGKAKGKSYDPLNNLATLLPQWVSQASARQRRGRAGRVQPGKCYRLYPRELHDGAMAPFEAPEMLRTPLEELCLQIKSLSLGGIEEFLSRALQPPEARAVHNAKGLLETIGALHEGTEELTALGRHLAHLPVDPRVGKMVVMGCVLGCLDPVLTIAAGLAYKDPWVIPLERKHEADEVRRRLAGGSQSDHLALVAAFEGWRRAGGYRERADYCWRHFLRQNTLELMSDMRLQFAGLLRDAGFLAGGGGPGGDRRHLEEEIARRSASAPHTELVRAVICAGMFPNVADVVQKKNRASFKTLDDGKVDPHPSSVVAAERFFEHRFLVYSQKVKTQGIYLMSSTAVPDKALLLFGGELHPGDRPGSLTMLGGNIAFHMAPGVADLVLRARRELEGLLERAAHDPAAGLAGPQAGHLVDAVVHLLSPGAGGGGGGGRDRLRRHYEDGVGAGYGDRR